MKLNTVRTIIHNARTVASNSVRDGDPISLEAWAAFEEAVDESEWGVALNHFSTLVENPVERRRFAVLTNLLGTKFDYLGTEGEVVFLDSDVVAVRWAGRAEVVYGWDDSEVVRFGLAIPESVRPIEDSTVLVDTLRPGMRSFYRGKGLPMKPRAEGSVRYRVPKSVLPELLQDEYTIEVPGADAVGTLDIPFCLSGEAVMDNWWG